MRVLALILLVITAALFTEAALYARNTFEHHPQWTLGKDLGTRAVFGVWECRRTRNLLARNELNLGVWHGFQEVLLDHVGRPELLKFRFSLASGACVYAFVHKSPASSAGVRLSRRPELPSCVFATDARGGFTHQRMLELSLDGRWHECTLARADSTWTLELDGNSPLSLGTLHQPPGAVGFQGSYAGARVDNVEVWEGQRRLVSETWRNDAAYGPLLAWSIAALALPAGVILAAGRFSRPAWLRVSALYLVGAAGLVLLFAFDYLYWSARYTDPATEAWAPGPIRELERWRLQACTRLDALDPALASDRLLPRFFAIDSRPEKRETLQVYPGGPRTMLFLGTSQTWGVGARCREDRMVAQLSHLLKGYQLVNASLWGGDSGELLARQVRLLPVWRPHVVVVALGNNETDPERLVENLRRMLELNSRHGVRSLVCLDANAPESGPARLSLNHQSMRRVAARSGVPCLELHEAMARQNGSGILWVDPVHPSSYGHALAAAALAEALYDEPAVGAETLVQPGSPGSERAGRVVKSGR